MDLRDLTWAAVWVDARKERPTYINAPLSTMPDGWYLAAGDALQEVHLLGPFMNLEFAANSDDGDFMIDYKSIIEVCAGGRVASVHAIQPRERV